MTYKDSIFHELVRRYQDPDLGIPERRAVLTELNQTGIIIVKTALRYFCKAFHVSSNDDHIQDAQVVFIKCCQRFQLNRGVKFSSYCISAILRELKRILFTKSSIITIPDRHARPYSGHEDKNRLARGVLSMSGAAFFDADQGSYSDWDNYQNTLADHHSPQVLYEENEYIEIILSKVDDKRRRAVILKFGLFGNHEHNCKEIALKMGIQRRTAQWYVSTSIDEFRRREGCLPNSFRRLPTVLSRSSISGSSDTTPTESVSV